MRNPVLGHRTRKKGKIFSFIRFGSYCNSQITKAKNIKNKQTFIQYTRNFWRLDLIPALNSQEQNKKKNFLDPSVGTFKTGAEDRLSYAGSCFGFLNLNLAGTWNAGCLLAKQRGTVRSLSPRRSSYIPLLQIKLHQTKGYQQKEKNVSLNVS